MNREMHFWLATIFGVFSLCAVPSRAIDGVATNELNWKKMRVIEPKGYVCYRAAHPIKIDGNIDAEEWKRAPWTDDFQDIEGGSKPKPRYRTKAKLLWDQDYLYVAAELEEPHVWGTLTEHDSVIFQDNDFEVFIDPNGDNHEYYEFEMNALNTTWDLFLNKPYKDEGKARDNWEIPGLKSAVKVQGTINDPSDTDRGWTIELAFPWKALGDYAHVPCPPADGNQWRVNFSRVEWQVTSADGKYRKVPGLNEDNWVWSPQGIVDMHRPEKWGFLQFSSGIGEAEFKRDPSLGVKDALYQIYYAQLDYRAAHGKWAKSIAQLGIKNPSSIGIEKFAAKLNGYDCSVKFQGVRWHIRQDSLVWRD